MHSRLAVYPIHVKLFWRCYHPVDSAGKDGIHLLTAVTLANQGSCYEYSRFIGEIVSGKLSLFWRVESQIQEMLIPLRIWIYYGWWSKHMFYDVSAIGYIDQGMQTIVSCLLVDSPKINYNNRCHVAPFETQKNSASHATHFVFRQCLVEKNTFRKETFRKNPELRTKERRCLFADRVILPSFSFRCRKL